MKLAYDFTVIASIEPVMTRKFDNFEEIIMEWSNSIISFYVNYGVELLHN